MMKSGVYRIVNIVNGDFYVGSSKNIDSRWRNHKSNARYYRDSGDRRSYLYRAIQKYGIDNFRIEIIEECVGKDTLISREQYYVDTLQPTYNILQRVNVPGCGMWTSERKAAYSTRRKAEVAAGINVPPPSYTTGNKDFRHSEESKQKIGASIAKARQRIRRERGSYVTPEGLASRNAKIQESLTPERRARFREETKEAVAKAHEVCTQKADTFAETYLPIIQEMQRQGLNAAQIAATLNEQGHRSPRGGLWSDQTIRQILKRLHVFTGADRLKHAEKARKARADDFAQRILPVIAELRCSGLNMSEVAEKLNERGFKSRRGTKWTYQSVGEVLRRAGQAPEDTHLEPGRVRQRKADEFAAKYSPIIREMKQQGMSHSQIAAKLNAEGHASFHGSQWTERMIKRLLTKMTEDEAIARKADKFAAKYLPIIHEMKQQGMSHPQIAAKLNAEGHTSFHGLQWTKRMIGKLLTKMTQDEVNKTTEPFNFGWTTENEHTERYYLGWDRLPISRRCR